jgi:hypothetical protein
MPMQSAEPVAQTLSFEKFWNWLAHHQNCILRAGTQELVLFDQEDFHWSLSREEDGMFLVRLEKGKNLVGELVLFSNDISYVQYEPGDGDEFVFECVVETASAREAAYHFVLTHSYEDQEPPAGQTGRRWTH